MKKPNKPQKSFSLSDKFKGKTLKQRAEYLTMLMRKKPPQKQPPK